MEEIKQDSEILAEIYRNAQLGVVSITDILPEVDDERIKEELLREHEEYERICSEAATLATKFGLELKEPNPMKKAMMWSAIKMGTASDNSAQNVAQMMIIAVATGYHDRLHAQRIAPGRNVGRKAEIVVALQLQRSYVDIHRHENPLPVARYGHLAHAHCVAQRRLRIGARRGGGEQEDTAK